MDRSSTGRGILTRLLHDRRGNTLAMAGAALVPIAGMIGSGLDMARAYMAQAKLQNACDAGALAARREMQGTSWSTSARQEGERFFDFNFPDGTMNAQNISRTIDQSDSDDSTVEVDASADVPTTVMSLFGKDLIPIAVTCDADQDYGNNDIMVVLDVTGSMQCDPGKTWGCDGGSGSKIDRLRSGAMGLYRALEGATNTRTRFGIMPYSGTVNVGGSLRNKDILRETYYQQRSGYSYDLTAVHINDTDWKDSTTGASIRNWRQSDDACIEARPTIGNSDQPIEIDSTSISNNDVDEIAGSATDTALQWGRYDPDEEEAESQSACPAPASRLRTYGRESAFQSAIDDATSRVTGGTYHDIGMIWGARFLSSTGMFSSDNPEEYNNVPVAKHIVFMTDGIIDTGSTFYSAFGVASQDSRMQGSGSLDERHVNHFLAACTRAKAMGMTVWVIVLDEEDVDDIKPCATSSGHFFTSDGSDLDEVFSRIGQGIGHLRLTQ